MTLHSDSLKKTKNTLIFSHPLLFTVIEQICWKTQVFFPFFFPPSFKLLALHWWGGTVPLPPDKLYARKKIHILDIIKVGSQISLK